MKKTKKTKILSLALSTIMAFGCIAIPSSLTASAVSMGSTITDAYGNTYELNSDHTLTFSRYLSNEKNFIMPSSIDGYEVTSIYSKAFSDSDISAIQISDNTTKISDCAFRDCVNLKSIYLNEGLLSINENAFQGCTSLKKISIPSTVSFVDDSAFVGTNIKYLSIADGATSVFPGESVKGMNVLRLPDSIKNGLTAEFYKDLYDKAIGGVGKKDFLIKCNKYDSNNNITDAYDMSKWYILPVATTDGETFGDVSGDGATNITDATILQRLSCGDELTAREMVYGDVNNDAVVNISDVTLIQRILANI